MWNVLVFESEPAAGSGTVVVLEGGVGGRLAEVSMLATLAYARVAAVTGRKRHLEGATSRREDRRADIEKVEWVGGECRD